MDVKQIQNFIFTLLIAVIAAIGGYYFGVKGYEIKLKTEVRNIEIVNKEAQLPDSVDFARFWEVWENINRRHIKRPLNPELLVEGAISGMVEAIGDPYTAYLNPEENKATKDSLNGKYEGIGAQLGFDESNRLIIVAPLDGSPAKEIGILPGDIIAAINDEDSTGISLDEAVSKIRGPGGTQVKLKIMRLGENPLDITITRREITVESVTWEDKGDGIAYIRLSRFGETTNQEWFTALSEINTEMPNLKGIILDVRSNPGGYLDSAVYIASEFISKGVIVSEDFSDGRSEEFPPSRKGVLEKNDAKLVVLINEGSASASEIVAGALKESANAILVGKRSFGKGTVQTAEEYQDGASLHVTIAKWLTPKENWIDTHNSEFKDSEYNEKDENGKEIVGGLKPDFEVEITDEDVKNSKDTQLEKAIEIIKSE